MSLIQSIGTFIIKDHVKVLMSMGDAWTSVNDTVARIYSKYKDLCPRFKVVDNNALTLNIDDARSFKTLVHLPCETSKLARSSSQRTSMDNVDTHQRQSQRDGSRHDTAHVAGKSKQDQREKKRISKKKGG